MTGFVIASAARQSHIWLAPLTLWRVFVILSFVEGLVILLALHKNHDS